MKIFVVGSINMDLVINAPYCPNQGETMSGSNFLQNPGGKGANQAVAVAKLGGDSFMVGAVGNAFGKDLIETLEGYGVNSKGVRVIDNVSSGVAVIVVVDGDNRIILDAGANGLLTKDLIDDAFKNASKGDYVICQLEVSQEIVNYTFEKAKELGMNTVLNPAPAKPLIDGILANTDYFIPNQTETELYTKIYPESDESIKSAYQTLKNLGVKNLLITLGVQGSTFINDKEFIHVNAHKVNAIDTTAAGDTFIGAFVTKLSEGASVKEAMEFASKASSITVTRRGAQVSIPYRKEL